MKLLQTGVRVTSNFLTEYLIFLNDDTEKSFDDNFIESLWNERSKKSFVAWNGRQLSKSGSYFNGSIPTIEKLVSGESKLSKFGSAEIFESIIDSAIFQDTNLLKIPRRFYEYESIWLSFLVNTQVDWRIVRTSSRPSVDHDLMRQRFSDFERLRGREVEEFTEFLQQRGFSCAKDEASENRKLVEELIGKNAGLKQLPENYKLGQKVSGDGKRSWYIAVKAPKPKPRN